jgi:hypothetical protein
MEGIVAHKAICCSDLPKKETLIFYKTMLWLSSRQNAPWAKQSLSIKAGSGKRVASFSLNHFSKLAQGAKLRATFVWSAPSSQIAHGQIQSSALSGN